MDKLKNKREKEVTEPIVEFKQEVVVYTDPVSFNFNSSVGYDMKGGKVTDFSLDKASDYKKAFTSIEFENLSMNDNNNDVLNNFEKMMADRASLDNNLFEKSKEDVKMEKIIQLKFEELINEKKEKIK
jgi:hypothetical protein